MYQSFKQRQISILFKLEAFKTYLTLSIVTKHNNNLKERKLTITK